MGLDQNTTVCTFDRDLSLRQWPARRKASLAASFLGIVPSLWLMAQHGGLHGETGISAGLGAAAGMGVGVGLVLARRRRI